MKRMVLLLSLIVWAPVALAVPEVITKKHPQLEKVGEAEYSVVFLDVYKISLHQDAENPRMNVLHIEYDMDLTAEKRLESAIADMKVQDGYDGAPYDDWEQQMREIFPEVEKGDTITLQFEQPGGTKFYHNGEYRGEIGDPMFSDAFSGIWLGVDSPNEGVRDQLLLNAHHK